VGRLISGLADSINESFFAKISLGKHLAKIALTAGNAGHDENMVSLMNNLAGQVPDLQGSGLFDDPHRLMAQDVWKGDGIVPVLKMHITAANSGKDYPGDGRARLKVNDRITLKL
jgi:hypothetical protein